MPLVAASSFEVLMSRGLSQMGQLRSVREERAIPYVSEEICSVTANGSGRTAINGIGLLDFELTIGVEAYVGRQLSETAGRKLRSLRVRPCRSQGRVPTVPQNDSPPKKGRPRWFRTKDGSRLGRGVISRELHTELSCRSLRVPATVRTDSGEPRWDQTK
jgi:hypothetical protein